MPSVEENAQGEESRVLIRPWVAEHWGGEGIGEHDEEELMRLALVHTLFVKDVGKFD